MSDREKYIEVLSKAAKTVKEFNEDAPIKISLVCIEDILELLKEQPEIVRCRDCKFWYKDECSHLCKITGDLHPANWYCADGERQ